MSAGVKYRQYAANCLLLAQVTNAPQDKTVLAEMAAMWLRLAEFTESSGSAARDGDEKDRR
jgi:hypothetical protein